MVTLQDNRRTIATDAPKVRIFRALKLCALFDEAARATVDRAVDAAEIEVVRAGTAIVAQDERATTVALLGHGRARLERKISSGQIVPLGYRGSGDLLAESCLAGSDTYTESAIAMDETEVVRLPLAVGRAYLFEDPAIGVALMGLMLARQREMEERIESLLFRDVEGRLAEFLLKAADRWGVPDQQGKGTLISAPITHYEIAQSIGSTRETVTITLGALRREGLLDVAGRRLIVVDAASLAKRR
jgi:CRP/FNR family transcriptional regulator, cyclic AMP receptor protein